jgi:hypothetical protein
MRLEMASWKKEEEKEDRKGEDKIRIHSKANLESNHFNSAIDLGRHRRLRVTVVH